MDKLWRFWRSWWFWKGGILLFSAATAMVLSYLQQSDTELLELIWISWLDATWLDVSKLDYDAGVIAPFYAGLSALAFLSPLVTEQSQKDENERTFDFGLRFWSGATGIITAGYWLSDATEENAVQHLVALTPLVLMAGLVSAMYFCILLLQQNRMSQSRGINGEGLEPPERELTPPMEVTDRVSFLFADARALYDNALEMLAQGKRRNAAEKAWSATKRATDALVLAREGGEPQSAGQARRALLRMSTGDPAVGTLQGEYHIRARMLHTDCFDEGNCEPEQEMAGLIRATISYIQTAEGLSAAAEPPQPGPEKGRDGSPG